MSNRKKFVRRAYNLLDDALDPSTGDPWWMVDEAKDELEDALDEMGESNSVIEYIGEDEVYVVEDENNGDLFVFTDLDEARDANCEGGWRRRSLKPAAIDPDESRWSVDE